MDGEGIVMRQKLWRVVMGIIVVVMRTRFNWAVVLVAVGITVLGTIRA
jgi:hypothetical protein